MKELFAFLRRFVRPYRRNLVGSVAYNLLSAILNVFSFALIVPILRILFKISTETYEYTPFSEAEGMRDFFHLLKDNFFYKVTDFISHRLIGTRITVSRSALNRCRSTLVTALPMC